MMHKIKYFRRYDYRVAVFYIVLRNLAFIGLHFLAEEINCKVLLQEGVALVFLIGEDALDRGGLPLSLTGGRGDAALCQVLGYAVRRLTLKKKRV